jgi:hypothetical protein
MKIQIRRRAREPQAPQITVREKTIYLCGQCHNRYYSYHFFCPQCLGVVASSAKHSSLLQITSCAPEELEEGGALLAKLAAISSFDYEAALKSAPWTCMMQSDPVILKVWKECLEAAKLSTEILRAAPETKSKRRKQHRPLFAENTPFPQFLPADLTEEMRALCASVPSASLKLQWAETACNAFRLVERIYKVPSERILFVDYLFQIEEHLREFTSRFASSKWAEQSFVKWNDKLKESFQRMESEMDAVREKVQDQL